MARRVERPEFQRKDPIDKIVSPFQQFFDYEASSGVVLLACVAVALFMANFGFADAYHAMLKAKFMLGLDGVFEIHKPLHLWINDGLMAVFFLLVGLEIKREVRVGELSELRQAVLPLAGAAGGMVVPAAFYLAVTWGRPEMSGWGVPMATDIAFALGILAMMGRRIPLGVKVFLAALAIVDDIGAVLVIALYYTSEVAMVPLWWAVAMLAVLVGFNRMHVRAPLPYMLAGLLLWYFLLKSGVHATLAGVLLAACIPAQVKSSPEEFQQLAQRYLDRFRECSEGSGSEPCVLRNPNQHAALMQLEYVSRSAETPLQRIEHNLIGWVTFVVVPVFALANAGVVFEAGLLESLAHPVCLGVMAGLALGKPLGVAGAAWLVLRLGWADLPKQVTMRHIWGAGCLSGIGFTMSLFIANLAFDGQDLLLGKVKLGILVASMAAWLASWVILVQCPFCDDEAWTDG